jgi:hypothetical protein
MHPPLQAEARITEIQRGQESQLRSLTPAARQQYSALLEERQALRQDAGRLDEALAELEREVGSAEGELGRNVLKQRALELQEQIRALADKKYELQVGGRVGWLLPGTGLACSRPAQGVLSAQYACLPSCATGPGIASGCCLCTMRHTHVL